MMSTDFRKQILIVDRDAAIVEPLRQRLSDGGFMVRVMTDGTAGLTAATEQPPHLLIIDWDLPGFATLDVIKEVQLLRAPQPVRLIILSGASGDDHVVTALNLGADDYIVKPFSIREAVARITGVLRTSKHLRPRTALKFAELELDSSTNRVTAGGRPINVRGTEYRLLEFLMSHTGMTFNRTQLLTRVWGGDAEVDERTVDVNVQRLRKVLKAAGYEAYIQTVRGYGYRFGAPLPRMPRVLTASRVLDERSAGESRYRLFSYD
jgi:two-component system, OmpR family, phosphate regulon response regulator PhoB